MENANLLLGNTLLLLAILLFLAVLPRALRQQKKSALDRTVERFEKFEQEELKAAGEEKPGQDDPGEEQTVLLKDRSLDYLKEDMLAALKTQAQEEIPPFPAQEKQDENTPAKTVKEGVAISHNDAAHPPPTSRKKIKLIKQEFSIAPSENRAPLKKAPSAPQTEKKNTAPAKDPNSPSDENSRTLSIKDHTNEGSDDNWVEAEIPGLIVEPLKEAKGSKSVPTFKASPKAKIRSGAKGSQIPLQKAKQRKQAKNIAPKSEERKGSTSKKPEKINTGSLELEIEISDSKPNAVEKKAPLVSHKSIAKKEAEPSQARASSSEPGEIQKAEDTAVPRQREDKKTSPEKTESKPFLLDLKYLYRDESETESPVARDTIPDEMVERVVARLNALQNELENHLATVPGERAQNEYQVDGNLRKNQTQDSYPDIKETIGKSSGKKEVSLDDLDSFLFTSTQRQNRK